ncbi:MAG: NAD(P)-dependent oxidoreductase [Sphingomonadaceae bacterium]
MTTRVGFVGLGQMGRWMAQNLLKAGYPLTVFNRTAEKGRFLVEQGASLASSPAELAAASEVVFLSLPNSEVVEETLFGPGGIVEGARSGMVVVDTSTISYMGTLEIARRLAERGIRFADAPVSGMEARAKDGTLTIMFGGDEGLFEEVLPALGAMGNTITRMGGVGSGQLTKLINQLLFNAAMASMAEVLPMAVKLGLDPEKVTHVVTTGTGRSFGLEFFAPRILENRFDQGYPLEKAYKDMASALEICAQQKIPLPMVQATATAFQLALAEGLGGEDKGALIKVYERLLGVRFRKGGVEA